MEVEEDTGSQKVEKLKAKPQTSAGAMTADQNEWLKHTMETRRTDISCRKKGRQVMERLLWNGECSSGRVAKCMGCAKTTGTKKLYERTIAQLGVKTFRKEKRPA